MKLVNFPKNFEFKVDIKKVALESLRPWVQQKIMEILGFDDDICEEFVFSLLESESDPKQIQIKLTGFFEDSTWKFMKQLWELLLSAQESVGGIPKVFLEAKKEEIRLQRERDMEILEGIKKVSGKDEKERNRDGKEDKSTYDSYRPDKEAGNVDGGEKRRSRHSHRRSDSRERPHRRDSRERSRRQDSRERSRRQDSRERPRRQDSRERPRRRDSRERSSRRRDSRERERPSRRDSRERARRDSRERPSRHESPPPSKGNQHPTTEESREERQERRKYVRLSNNSKQ
ncbi:PWI domain-containing protein [Globomyces pollinis-pini]|nr:PWI domain-containing protein [Globomyces pollinis-pini]